MSRLGKMPSWQRSFVIYGMMACSITGLMYLLGHQFHIQRSTLGTHTILAAHGIAAMLATLALGSVLPFHIKAGYKSKKQWWSGFSQLGFLFALLITGGMLYYGPEELRDGVINVHWIIGLLFAIIFLLHLTAIRKPKTIVS
ncbi:hypothetical protein ICN18_04560 [Polynucleobacter sp. Ross1-W9]|uniref:hypothetical protein n=1 Tax=Polynucleobacter parvulilacunae TaxID=1855631 RepID=UPI001C0BD712|nr:hypothetical protein [Polynucleobacter parvulilacunae]MBU3556896.1 hypothetical protein [Polynucleobacter parvulilacunae]